MLQTVMTTDTGRDITGLVENAAREFGFDPIGLIGGAIAESDLREHAARLGVWPDVSFGLWQPAVKFLERDVPGLSRDPANNAVFDTDANRSVAREFSFDAARLITYVAPRYNRLLRRWGDPLEAWCRWNAPGIPGISNRNRDNYVRGLIAAEAFRGSVVEAGERFAAPPISWVDAHSSNFAPRRFAPDGRLIAPEAWVNHIADGSFEGLASWFNVPADRHFSVGGAFLGASSTHFSVARDGRIQQHVAIQDTAFANGGIEGGFTSTLVAANGFINPNLWTVSCEHEGFTGDIPTEAQFDSSTRLCARVFASHIIPGGATDVAIDRVHILRHTSISPQSRPRCPGWPESVMDDYVARVAELVRGKQSQSGFMIQSNFGTAGNFELVVPNSAAAGGLTHCWRDNDRPASPWNGPIVFGAGDHSDVAVIQSNFGAGRGNFEAVGRRGTDLVLYRRDDQPPFTWNGPAPLSTITEAVSGNPAMIQSRFGGRGNFELVVPLVTGGLAHYWRDNDNPALPWHGPIIFGDPAVVDAVAMTESTVGGAGVLEVVARVGGSLVLYTRGPAPGFAWSGPVAVPLAGPAGGLDASGIPAIIHGRFGGAGNYEVVVPLSSGGLAHIFRDNDDRARPWSEAVQFGAGNVEAASLIQSTFGSIGLGNLEVAARIGQQTRHYIREDTAPFAWSGPAPAGCQAP